MSVRLLSFNFLWGSKLMRFMAAIEHTQQKLLHFVNRHNARSSKCVKNGLSMTIFFDDNDLDLFKIDFHTSYFLK